MPGRERSDPSITWHGPGTMEPPSFLSLFTVLRALFGPGARGTLVEPPCLWGVVKLVFLAICGTFCLWAWGGLVEPPPEPPLPGLGDADFYRYLRHFGASGLSRSSLATLGPISLAICGALGEPFSEVGVLGL